MTRIWRWLAKRAVPDSALRLRRSTGVKYWLVVGTNGGYAYVRATQSPGNAADWAAWAGSDDGVRWPTGF